MGVTNKFKRNMSRLEPESRDYVFQRILYYYDRFNNYLKHNAIEVDPYFHIVNDIARETQ